MMNTDTDDRDILSEAHTEFIKAYIAREEEVREATLKRFLQSKLNSSIDRLNPQDSIVAGKLDQQGKVPSAQSKEAVAGG